MKKSLIALAALSAFATAAQAQSSVTVYGLLDTAYDVRENTDASNVKAKTSAISFGSFATNRIGFRGTEDLGGGLKANFQIETGITYGAAPQDSTVNLTTANGGTSFGDRAAWVELASSKSGSLRIGRQNTGARDTFLATDAGGALNVAGSLNSSTGNDSGNATAFAADTLANTGSHAAFENAVKYTTPSFGGLTVTAGISANKVENSTANAVGSETGNGYSIAARYTAGPLLVLASYSDTDTKAGASATATSYARNMTNKTTSAGATYDFKVAKLHATYMKLDVVDAVDPTSTGGTNVQRESTVVGITAPVTANFNVFAMMGSGEIQQGSTAYNGDLEGTQLGANYALSKRTTAKFAYGTTKRDVSASTTTKVKEYAFGLVHTF